MQATIVSGGEDGFNRMLYGDQRSDVTEYLRDRIYSVLDRVSDSARSFYERSMERFERFHSADAARAIRSATRKIRAMSLRDEIQELIDIAHFQHMPTSMIPLMMAFPDIRREYHRGEIDGYSTRYVDHQPGVVGIGHRDYQILADGLAVDEDLGLNLPTEGMCISFDLEENEQPLSHDQRVDLVLSACRQRVIHSKRQEDSTSPYGAYL